MRRYLSLMLLLALPVLATAQQSIKLQEKNIYKEGTNIILEYNINMEGYDWCEVALYVSFNGGKAFPDTPMTNVIGDVGRITSSGDKKIVWQIGKNISAYAGRDISFKINVERSRKSKASKSKTTAIAANNTVATSVAAKPVTGAKPAIGATPATAAKPTKQKPPRKSATFIMAELGGISPISYGLMIGWSSPKAGFYFKGLSNFNFTKATMTVDDTGKIVDGGTGYIFATGNKAHSMLMGTAGLLIPFGNAVYMNLGVGYGSRSYLWETTTDTWAKVESTSASSVAFDLGLIFKIKKFAFSIGGGYILPKCIIGQFGIGVAF